MDYSKTELFEFYYCKRISFLPVRHAGYEIKHKHTEMFAQGRSLFNGEKTQL